VLFIEGKRSGRLKFLLPRKKDVVIARYELERLFDEDLEVVLAMDAYKKALKKYEQMRNS
jgi:hypothetical protein